MTRLEQTAKIISVIRDIVIILGVLGFLYWWFFVPVEDDDYYYEYPGGGNISVDV